MNNKVQVIGKNTKKTELVLRDIISDVENSLKLSIDFVIKIRLHNTRKSFDKQLGKKTQDWEVGNTSENNEIDIIHEDYFEKNSSHSKEDFIKILKHEIIHIYLKKISENKTIPMWLNEGLSMYIAGQIVQYKEIGVFIEDDYLNKISTEYGWNKYSNYSAYAYSCLFIEYLVNKYSLDKVIDLLRKNKVNYYNNSFNRVFNNIFGLDLKEAEKKFILNLD